MSEAGRGAAAVRILMLYSKERQTETVSLDMLPPGHAKEEPGRRSLLQMEMPESGTCNVRRNVSCSRGPRGISARKCKGVMGFILGSETSWEHSHCLI